MLKIEQLFISRFLFLLMSALFIISLVSYLTLKSSIIKFHQEHLKNAIELISIDREKQENIEEYIEKIHQSTGISITIMDAHGVIIAKTDKEVIERESLDLLFVEKQVEYKNDFLFIRFSSSMEKVLEDFHSLCVKLLLFMGLFLLITYYISKRMSAKVEYDIKQIAKYLDEISDKNYKAIIKTKYFYEFLHLSLLLKNVVKKLSNHEKQKRKLKAKLKDAQIDEDGSENLLYENEFQKEDK